MPSKNNLSALKKTAVKPTILPETTTAKPQTIPKTRKTGKVGRPQKDVSEKRDYKITLSLTQAQGKAIAEKAGLAGEATYLYAELKRTGMFK